MLTGRAYSDRPARGRLATGAASRGFSRVVGPTWRPTSLPLGEGDGGERLDPEPRGERGLLVSVDRPHQATAGVLGQPAGGGRSARVARRGGHQGGGGSRRGRAPGGPAPRPRRVCSVANPGVHGIEGHGRNLVHAPGEVARTALPLHARFRCNVRGGLDTPTPPGTEWTLEGGHADDPPGPALHPGASPSAARARSALARSHEGVTPEDAIDCVQEALCTLLASARRRRAAGGGRRVGRNHSATAHGPQRGAQPAAPPLPVAFPHVDLDTHPPAGEDAPATDEVIAWGEDHVRLRFAPSMRDQAVVCAAR